MDWIRKWVVALGGAIAALAVIGWVGHRLTTARRRKMEAISASSYANSKVIWAESRAESNAARKAAEAHLTAAKQHAVEADELAKKVTAAKLKLARIREELGL